MLSRDEGPELAIYCFGVFPHGCTCPLWAAQFLNSDSQPLTRQAEGWQTKGVQGSF